MSLLPKAWSGSVRDAVVQSIRRAPSTNTYNGDSLRRLALHRNAVKATLDAPSESNKPTTLRRLSSDERNGVRVYSSGSTALRRSRSVQQMDPAFIQASEAIVDNELEDQWFDNVFAELCIDESRDIQSSFSETNTLNSPEVCAIHFSKDHDSFTAVHSSTPYCEING